VQKSLLAPAQQREIATMHACIVAHVSRRLGARYGAPPPAAIASDAAQHDASTACEDAAFARGCQLLELCGGAVPAAVDAVATGALMSQLVARIAELDAGGAATGVNSGGIPKAEGLDMAEANADEAALAVAPVGALLARVRELLARFEEQPMLLQLQAICQRILGAPSFS
jgi:hypothetical protein